MRKVSLALLAALLSASPVSALDGETSKKERRTCQEEPRLGSRLKPKRICLTAKEWRQVATASKDELDRFVNRSLVVGRQQPGVPR